MSIINIVSILLCFTVLTCGFLLGLLSNIKYKRPYLWGFLPVFISTNFLMLTIFIIYISDSIKHLSILSSILTYIAVILRIVCLFFLIYGYTYPLLKVIMGRVKPLFVIIPLVILQTLAILTLGKNSSFQIGKYLYIAIFIILTVIPIPFMFNNYWRKISEWEKYPYFYPLSTLILLLTVLAKRFSFTLYNTSASLFTSMQIILFMTISFLHIRTSIKDLLSRQKAVNIAANKLNLTARELEVTKLLIDAKSYKEISEILNISVKTVNTHIYNIYKKCNVENKIELLNKLQE